MKANKAEFKKISSKVDDHGKRLKDYNLRNAIWNVRSLYRVVASAKLAYAFMKCAIQEMRWTGQKCKRLATCDVYYSCHVDKPQSASGQNFITSA